MFRYTVDVSFTTRRPVVPDQHTSRVTLLAESDEDAFGTAFSMIYGRPSVEMVTRVTIQEVEL